jgi:hypothetical protein
MKCVKCKVKERYSTHANCKYCANCRDLMYLEGVKRGIKKWKSKNKEHLSTYRKENMHKWKEVRNIKLREKRDNLDDSYVIQRLTANNSLSAKDIPKQLIELKKLDILLLRHKIKRRKQQ